MLTSETEWRKAAELLVKRAEAARSKAVSMQIKDMVSTDSGQETRH
jgi:hypothetical protein